MLRLVLVVGVVLVLGGVAFAQEAQTDAQRLEDIAKRLEAAETRAAAAEKRVTQLEQQKPKPTREQVNRESREGYGNAWKNAIERAMDACYDVGGYDLLIPIDPTTGNPTIACAVKVRKPKRVETRTSR